MKEPCQRWTSLLNFGDVSGKEMTIHPICYGWRKCGKSWRRKLLAWKSLALQRMVKRFRLAQKVLKKEFAQLRDDNRLIPTWWLVGRTVMIPKSKDLSHEKNYRPIRYLNTQYNHLNGLVGKFMRNDAMENNIWWGSTGSSRSLEYSWPSHHR